MPARRANSACESPEECSALARRAEPSTGVMLANPITADGRRFFQGPGPRGAGTSDERRPRQNASVGADLLYLHDAYLTRFSATVTAVDGQRVALHQTAFYPTGGGQ